VIASLLQDTQHIIQYQASPNRICKQAIASGLEVLDILPGQPTDAQVYSKIDRFRIRLVPFKCFSKFGLTR
jgi:hypothetical protein